LFKTATVGTCLNSLIYFSKMAKNRHTKKLKEKYKKLKGKHKKLKAVVKGKPGFEDEKKKDPMSQMQELMKGFMAKGGALPGAMNAWNQANKPPGEDEKIKKDLQKAHEEIEDMKKAKVVEDERYKLELKSANLGTTADDTRVKKEMLKEHQEELNKLNAQILELQKTEKVLKQQALDLASQKEEALATASNIHKGEMNKLTQQNQALEQQAIVLKKQNEDKDAREKEATAMYENMTLEKNNELVAARKKALDDKALLDIELKHAKEEAEALKFRYETEQKEHQNTLQKEWR
jgi:hypothetical protein